MSAELDVGVSVVLGGQWGDEGKGKLVDMLAAQADYVCRCQGGNNAGHTVIVGGTSYDFHLLPSGMVQPDCINVIGNGVVIHVPSLFEELEKNEKKGLQKCHQRLLVSNRAHLVFDFHQLVDGLMEEEKGRSSLGTTKKGIGPAYSSKANRIGLRVCDLLGDWDTFSKNFRHLVQTYEKRFGGLLVVDVESELAKYKVFAERLRPMVCDAALIVNKAITANKKVVVEGANAAMLDIDFGTYPFVTSSNCTVGGVMCGLGIPPTLIKHIFGVFKAYTTRVGAGAFPTELNNEIGDKLQTIGHEFGVTTGRKRRCGWFDAVVARYSIMINGFTSIALTKLDVMDSFEEVKIGISYLLDGKELENYPADQTQLHKVTVKYLTLPGWQAATVGITKFEELPVNAQSYVLKLEELISTKITWIGTGPGRSEMITRS